LFPPEGRAGRGGSTLSSASRSGCTLTTQGIFKARNKHVVECVDWCKSLLAAENERRKGGGEMTIFPLLSHQPATAQ
jgi:hypothetical protein